MNGFSEESIITLFILFYREWTLVLLLVIQ